MEFKKRKKPFCLEKREKKIFLSSENYEFYIFSNKRLIAVTWRVAGQLFLQKKAVRALSNSVICKL
jgi:hypothetical protein